MTKWRRANSFFLLSHKCAVTILNFVVQPLSWDNDINCMPTHYVQITLCMFYAPASAFLNDSDIAFSIGLFIQIAQCHWTCVFNIDQGYDTAYTCSGWNSNPQIQLTFCVLIFLSYRSYKHKLESAYFYMHIISLLAMQYFALMIIKSNAAYSICIICTVSAQYYVILYIWHVYVDSVVHFHHSKLHSIMQY